VVDSLEGINKKTWQVRHGLQSKKSTLKFWSWTWPNNISKWLHSFNEQLSQ